MSALPLGAQVMLSSRVAVITGAGRGIGARAAEMLARNGASVVVNDMSEEASSVRSCSFMSFCTAD